MNTSVHLQRVDCTHIDREHLMEDELPDTVSEGRAVYVVRYRTFFRATSCTQVQISAGTD